MQIMCDVTTIREAYDGLTPEQPEASNGTLRTLIYGDAAGTVMMKALGMPSARQA
jgi:hypothetical protein